MKKLSDIMNMSLAMGGTLKAGCYKGLVKDITKTVKNGKSYLDIKVKVKDVVYPWRIFDVNRFKLEYKLATGEDLKKMKELIGKDITFYATVDGRFNRFSMLQFLPDVGSYEVTYGGVAVSEECSAFAVKLIFDEEVTCYDIKMINSDEDLARFVNYTMSSIAYQLGFNEEFTIAQLEDHVGEPLIVNIIKKAEYKSKFLNYDVITTVSLSEEDEIENLDELDEEF